MADWIKTASDFTKKGDINEYAHLMWFWYLSLTFSGCELIGVLHFFLVEGSVEKVAGFHG